ncbi:TetR/AcrR family transcriptional regulator [Nocardia africana]
MTETDVRRRPGGRSARVRRAVLDATLELLTENGGAEEPTMSEIAARSGVHETSIYRRWGTREKLVIDALLSHSEQQLPIPDTGSLRSDLAIFGTELADYLDHPLGMAIARALTAPATEDTDIAQMRAEFWRTRFETAGIMITRAVERGELPPDTDPGLVLEILIAPLHFRALLTHRTIERTLPGTLAGIIATGCAAPAGGRTAT